MILMMNELRIVKYCKSLTLLLFLFFSFFLTQAQDYKSQYKAAKEFFVNEKFAEAIDSFNPLITYDNNNPYSEYALFYTGLSSQKLGYTLLAKQTFVQLSKLYPTWNNIDEVNLQLATIYFNQGDYFQAMKALVDTNNSSVMVEAENAKNYFISTIDDIETLSLLLEEFPTDSIIAHQLAIAISNQGYLPEYRPLFDSLIQKYNFDTQGFPQIESAVAIFKKSYRVSLLFPFLSSSLDPSPLKKKNQFVIDFYQGMKLANDTLAKRGIQLDIIAYDTERSLDTLKKILRSDELKSSDAIVGPLFTDEYRLVNDYSIREKIPIINPVTNNEEYLDDNKYALLYQPSNATLGTKSAMFAEQSIVTKTCMIYYGDTQKDSIMANQFAAKAIELGIKVLLMEGVTKETAPKILTTLATPTNYDKWHNPIEFTKKRNSIGCIYMASDNPLIFSKVINAVEARSDSTLVIGSESWIKDNSIDLGIYERLGVVFAAPTYTSGQNSTFIDFRKYFILKHGSFPSTYDNYAKTGYDFTLFLGVILNNYGSLFLDKIKTLDYMKGTLSEGFSFENSNNNQYVPFIQFREGQLEVIKMR